MNRQDAERSDGGDIVSEQAAPHAHSAAPGRGRHHYVAGIAAEPRQLEGAFRVRRLVFVEEQAVPAEEEWDSYDPVATHLIVSAVDGEASDPDLVVATARLVEIEPGIGKVGRVAVLKPFRSRGIGAQLMTHVDTVAKARQCRMLVLHSQCTVIPFYERLGYVAEGPVFQEARIDHRLMRKELCATSKESNS
jgi:predicted GNAT family N-acyltransferase